MHRILFATHVYLDDLLFKKKFAPFFAEFVFSCADLNLNERRRSVEYAQKQATSALMYYRVSRSGEIVQRLHVDQ